MFQNFLPTFFAAPTCSQHAVGSKAWQDCIQDAATGGGFNMMPYFGLVIPAIVIIVSFLVYWRYTRGAFKRHGEYLERMRARPGHPRPPEKKVSGTFSGAGQEKVPDTFSGAVDPVSGGVDANEAGIASQKKGFFARLFDRSGENVYLDQVKANSDDILEENRRQTREG